MQDFDFDSMRAIALDSIAAASDLERWAHRSQEDDYDVDSAVLHLDVIEKAQAIFCSLMRILPMGMDLNSTEPLRHFPIFDQLALASAHEIARPVFGGCATAHEAAFGRLTRAFMHIASSLNANLGIEGLHGLSPEQLRDTLSQLEKKYPIKTVLESSDQDYSLIVWIHREWAAASAIPPQARKNAKTKQGQENHFLSTELGDREASRIVDGETLTAEFRRNIKPWDMFCVLYHAGQNGLARADILKKLYAGQAITDNTLDQHKSTANKILKTLRVEIKPDNRGVWRLADLNS